MLNFAQSVFLDPLNLTSSQLFLLDRQACPEQSEGSSSLAADPSLFRTSLAIRRQRL
ncbi:MAG: hypothetical protein QHJ81_11635 [Anaerolineae bacterium]|nr:hypothetical protein [Anaerolineae bacterium]